MQLESKKFVKMKKKDNKNILILFNIYYLN